MKNVINYYYNLNPENIHQRDKKVTFFISNDYYVFMPFNRNMEELDNIYQIIIQLLNNGIFCHQIIPNNNRSLVTLIDNKPYVLLKVYYSSQDKIELNNIIDFSKINIKNIGTKIERHNWGELWSEKIDYFEYQVSQFGKKYPIVRDSFSYFVGLAETAISFFNVIQKEGYKVISHRRISYNNNFFDLYNPLEFVIDYRVRNIAEYLKSSFFHSSEDILLNIINYIEIAQLTPNECLLLFARMLFPSFYFDKYEQVIHNEADESDLLLVIDQVNLYERFLKEFYLYLKNHVQFPDIEWFNNRY